MQNKQPHNEQGQRHGLWELYHDNGQLKFKGLFINGTKFGKFEYYYHDGNLYFAINYINDERYGYYEHYAVGKGYYAK